MDVEEALKTADVWGSDYGNGALRASRVLAAEVRRLREVLAAYQIEAARERGGT